MKEPLQEPTLASFTSLPGRSEEQRERESQEDSKTGSNTMEAYNALVFAKE
jgi:hypothetical protein